MPSGTFAKAISNSLAIATNHSVISSPGISYIPSAPPGQNSLPCSISISADFSLGPSSSYCASSDFPLVSFVSLGTIRNEIQSSFIFVSDAHLAASLSDGLFAKVSWARPTSAPALAARSQSVLLIVPLLMSMPPSGASADAVPVKPASAAVQSAITKRLETPILRFTRRIATAFPIELAPDGLNSAETTLRRAPLGEARCFARSPGAMRSRARSLKAFVSRGKIDMLRRSGAIGVHAADIRERLHLTGGRKQ